MHTNKPTARRKRVTILRPNSEDADAEKFWSKIDENNESIYTISNSIIDKYSFEEESEEFKKDINISKLDFEFKNANSVIIDDDNFISNDGISDFKEFELNDIATIKTDTDNNTKTRINSKTVSKPINKTDSKTNTKTNTKTNSKPINKTNNKTVSKPINKTNSKPINKANSKTNTKTKTTNKTTNKNKKTEKNDLISKIENEIAREDEYIHIPETNKQEGILRIKNIENTQAKSVAIDYKETAIQNLSSLYRNSPVFLNSLFSNEKYDVGIICMQRNEHFENYEIKNNFIFYILSGSIEVTMRSSTFILKRDSIFNGESDDSIAILCLKDVQILLMVNKN